MGTTSLRLYGPTDHAYTLNALATCYNKSGNHVEAYANFQQAAYILDKIYGPEHVQTLAARGNCSLALYKLGRTAESVELGSTLLQMCKRLLGCDHHLTAKLQRNLDILISGKDM